jgi:L-ascorbate metabolism protein UlaG (beta-lactamase superfamily)
VKIQWLGHASLLITAQDGTKIITDPYTPGVFGVNYSPIDESADIVTVSHDHPDHNNVAAVKGSPTVVRGAGTQTVKGIPFKGVATYHDPTSGSQRGTNTIFCFTVDGVRVCHLGDLGHTLSDETAREIGEVDVLLVPVGGNFTIDAATARQVVEKLCPKVVIPMHFRTERCPDFPVAGVDDFLSQMTNVQRAEGSEVEYRKETLPAPIQTVVLRPAR